MIEARVLVLGLGGIGSAATYWLSRRLGPEVIGIEQFPLGHARGGSEDHSRIIRLSYHNRAYVELARKAYLAWEELEAETGESVVLRTGGLDLAPAGAAIDLDVYRQAMTAAGVGFTELDADAVMRHWPQWRLADDVSALFQEQSGLVRAYGANRAHRRMAREHGATLHDSLPVASIRERTDAIEIDAGSQVFRAEKLVIAAGAWSNPLLSHLGVQFPLDVTQEQVVYLHPRRPMDFHPARFPIWIWMDEPCFYGFPIAGRPSVKVAWDRCQVLTTPETRSFEPDQATTETIRGFANKHLPNADGGLDFAKTCLYTLTPDRDFVIDRVPGSERCYVAIGAGHAFKFASLIGRLLAELALDGSTEVDLSMFSASRAILGEANPVRTYLV